MIGKKNIVFGFLYLVLTAALGPYMVTTQLPEVGAATAEKQQAVGRLQQLKTDNYEENLEPVETRDLAKANTDGVLGMNKVDNAGATLNEIKAGPHAHGNLEALLNIVVGIALIFIAVAPLFKQIISWLFIVGALLHSGALYLNAFGIGLGGVLLGTGIGPILILVGLLLAGVAALMGFRAEVVDD